MLAALLVPFFLDCGQPNPDRSALPEPLVLLLLMGEPLEEVGGEMNEGTGPLGYGWHSWVFGFLFPWGGPPAALAAFFV